MEIRGWSTTIIIQITELNKATAIKATVAMEIKAIKCAPLFVVGMCEQEEIKNKVTSLNLLA